MALPPEVAVEDLNPRRCTSKHTSLPMRAVMTSTPTIRNRQFNGGTSTAQPSSNSAIRANEDDEDDEEFVITSIQAVDVAVGLRRLPVGFYTTVQSDGFEWRTANKPVTPNHNAVEWSGPIPIPPDLSGTVRFGVYASFEFEPMLGNGEQLRDLTISVAQLLEHSLNDLPFTFFARDKDIISPCSSLFVTVSRKKHRNGNSSALGLLDPYGSIAEPLSKLEEATNHGHSALTRYRKCEEVQDLDYSVEQFEYALILCPPDHPCHSTAQSNLAMAKLIRARDGVRALLDVPFTLYRDVLATRPVGHPDRPSTLIQLAVVLFARFEKLYHEEDATQAEALLYHVRDLCSTGSHEHQAAMFLLRLCNGRNVGNEELGLPSAKQLSALDPANEDLWTFSSQLLGHFEQSRDVSDLQRAISLLEAISQSNLACDRRYPEGVMNLGVAFWYQFRQFGELKDLEKAISSHKRALELMPDDHPHRTRLLNSLADFFRAKFQHLGKLSDLEHAISRHRDALRLTIDGHHDKPSFLNNLAISSLARFRHLGSLGDLEDAISGLREAVRLTPECDLSALCRLNDLAGLLRTRFERLGELSDVREAISIRKEVVQLSPNGHPNKPDRLRDLPITLVICFRRFGQSEDLEEAISLYRETLRLTSDDHPSRPGFFNSLANALVTRFEHLGMPGDLEEAILSHMETLRLAADDHPHKHGFLSCLASALICRFERFGDLSDLEEAISTRKKALELTPDGHPDKPGFLSNLARSFVVRFDCLSELADIEEAVVKHRIALQLTPDGHPDKPGFLSNLAQSLRLRFQRTGSLDDLEEVISGVREALQLTPDGHPDKSSFLGGLALSLIARFERCGDLGDLEKAISRFREAAQLTPDDHPDKFTQLNDIAGSLRYRFDRLGELCDLEEAISISKKAVQLTPENHPRKPFHLNNLATLFVFRFERLGKLSDLEEAISIHKTTLPLIPDDHPDKPNFLLDLSTSLYARFTRLGDLGTLEESISRRKEAIQLTPSGHPDRPSRLNSLATALATRFQRLGELTDLDEAISILLDVLQLASDDHPHKPFYLNDLATSYVIRFKQLGNSSDLEEATPRHREALCLIPDDHPEKSNLLSSLAHSLVTRFRRHGELKDIEEAISKINEAVQITPDGHPAKPDWLNNLAVTFKDRFQHLYELNDIEEAISWHRRAEQLTPDNHRNKSIILNNLADSLVLRFEHLGHSSDLEEARLHYSCAATSSTGATSTRFTASQQWIVCTRLLGHHSLLHAYSVAIGLLPQLAWIGLSLKHRFHQLMQGADLAREGAGAALDLGRRELAVEWLERGRSVVWGELFQLRSSFDDLWSLHPAHARQLQDLSAALEEASAVRDKFLYPLPKQTRTQGTEPQPLRSLEQEADKHRALAIERDDLLTTIRAFPGFERFLLHKEFSQLHSAAHSGPVVILNAAERRCDALILLADAEDVIHVPLPNLNSKRCANLQMSLNGLLGRYPTVYVEREGKPSVLQEDANQWESILSVLWKSVVKPILDALGFSTLGNLPRIFWCPTGPFTFLPIHAAGFYHSEYSQPGDKVSDFVVSLYTPTLSILLPSSKPSFTPSDHLRFLAVRQPVSDGLRRLAGVNTELIHIRTVIEGSSAQTTTFLESSLGTVEEVLELMKEASWVHFACHGIQDSQSPIDSGLCLADQRLLKLSDMIALKRPRGGLAFLSACQTATGDRTLADEAIHVAAGMLFAGYGGVIGTMWAIKDSVAPQVAKDVYERLFRSDGVPDHREAAHALHEAIGRLRENDASFAEWLPFIHVGL